MSMSTHIVGFRPADDQWNRMKAVWEACEAANTEVPQAVRKFFDGEAPGDKPGMEVEIERTGAAKKWRANDCSGFELDVTKLPEGVRFVRFYNSY